MQFRFSLVILFVLVFYNPVKSLAGLKWIEVGINGLTCSLCSRSVENSLGRLAFVSKVEMKLEETEAKIFLKENEEVDLLKIEKAIASAGFSIRFLKLAINFNDVVLASDGFFSLKGNNFYWQKPATNPTNPNTILKVVDPVFLSGKEKTFWKKNIGPLSKSNLKVFHVVQEA